MLKLLTKEPEQDLSTPAIDVDGRPRPIDENSAFAAARAVARKIDDEITSIDRRIQAIQRFNYEREQAVQATGDAALALAKKIIDGDTAADNDDPAEIPKLQRRRVTLVAARCRQAEVIDKLRGDLSFAVCMAKRELHRKALRDLLSAARLLARAATAEQTIRREIIDAGYFALEVLPAPRLAAPLTLGSESHSDSALSHYRRQLEDLGVIAR